MEDMMDPLQGVLKKEHDERRQQQQQQTASEKRIGELGNWAIGELAN